MSNPNRLEKILPVAACAIAIGTIAAGANVSLDADRSLQPELGNNPAAVAVFNKALQGEITPMHLPAPEDHVIAAQKPQFDFLAKAGDSEEKLAGQLTDNAVDKAEVLRQLHAEDPDTVLQPSQGLHVDADLVHPDKDTRFDPTSKNYDL